jgi:L-seryl-tRNA(Ser) seleniumtransferase
MTDGKKGSGKKGDPRRDLPAASVLLEEQAIKELVESFSHPLVMDSIHDTLAWYRSNLKPGDKAPSRDEVLGKVKEMLLKGQHDRIRPVVNASGIILHTGLGRAVLPRQAADALGKLYQCCNLQIDLETGQRGKRNYMTEYLLTKITGAEDAMVVNNNAAATLLILAALCNGKEVIISRGQLIEIGGSYRLPDCIHQSGATMVEVGTTNKTHLRDYEAALSENTGAVLRCNPSNYRIVGFTQDVPTADLVTLKKKQPVIVIDDLGCGALLNLEPFGLPKEPTIQESIAAGADVVCSSGDKLIGGPQAGIIVGKKDLIAKIRKHPLTRMLRVCKLTDTALEQTLRLFLDPETLIQKNPTLRMIATPIEELKKRATKLKKMIEKAGTSLEVRVAEGESATGGGSLPTTPLKTWVVALSSPTLSAGEICYQLRQYEPPVMARIKNEEVLLDVRTLLEGEDAIVVEAVQNVSR